MTLVEIGLLLGAGAAAGWINIVAGGGSLLTLPALVFCGLGDHVANATNRVAILVQNASAILAYRRKGLRLGWRPWLLALPACVGAVIGAKLAIALDPYYLRLAIGVMFLLMAGLIALQPKRWLGDGAERPLRWSVAGPSLFALGIYGGFLQAGVGVPLLVVLVMTAGYDLVKGNNAKVIVVFTYTVLVLTLFARAGQVDWTRGAVLAAGNATGAALGASWVSDAGAAWVRRVLLAVVVLYALRSLLPLLG